MVGASKQEILKEMFGIILACWIIGSLFAVGFIENLVENVGPIVTSVLIFPMILVILCLIIYVLCLIGDIICVLIGIYPKTKIW
jgi:hypothetical protein